MKSSRRSGKARHPPGSITAPLRAGERTVAQEQRRVIEHCAAPIKAVSPLVAWRTLEIANDGHGAGATAYRRRLLRSDLQRRTQEPTCYLPVWRTTDCAFDRPASDREWEINRSADIADKSATSAVFV